VGRDRQELLLDAVEAVAKLGEEAPEDGGRLVGGVHVVLKDAADVAQLGLESRLRRRDGVVDRGPDLLAEDLPCGADRFRQAPLCSGDFGSSLRVGTQQVR
jgi:hypothetical protein